MFGFCCAINIEVSSGLVNNKIDDMNIHMDINATSEEPIIGFGEKLIF